ncbi:ABC transporter permease [Ilumatobacter sp.]|uniref:ABC transporter permease n=1 Tax=Ilumatobacter sp. TaxID=1967498 RepID=UPI003C54A5EA
MDVVLSIATLSAGLRLALPVAIAALGALISERAGVLNLGLEGLMVSGALAGYLVTYHTGSPWLGLLGGLVTGAVCGLVLAAVLVGLRANQIVTGLAFTILAGSATSFLYQRSFSFGQNPPRIERIGMPALVVLTLIVLGLVIFLMRKTVAGLVVAAVGETPVAADALGYNVVRTRYLATIAGSALAALGGAVLVCGPLGLFIQNVTAGRGWVALALVVFAGWRPLPCVLGAFLFGLCDAVQLRIQGTNTGIPYEVFLALPYVVTLLALVIRGRNSRTPAALGVPFDRQLA